MYSFLTKNIIIYDYKFFKKKVIIFYIVKIEKNKNIFYRQKLFFFIGQINPINNNIIYIFNFLLYERIILIIIIFNYSLYIYQDKYLKYQNYTIKIVLGKVINFNIEFDKLKAFYKQSLNKIRKKKYEIVNLQYKNQVIATKR